MYLGQSVTIWNGRLSFALLYMLLFPPNDQLLQKEGGGPVGFHSLHQQKAANSGERRRGCGEVKNGIPRVWSEIKLSHCDELL